MTTQTFHANLRPAVGICAARAGIALCLALSLALPAVAWGKTRLVRKYRPGEQHVYQTSVRTSANINSNPQELKALLPPLPTDLSMRQQNTITVRSVDASGVAEVENRFDRVEFDSNHAVSLPEDMREAAETAQGEFARQLTGQTLTARYDRAGRLLEFSGAEAAIEKLSLPMQEAARQTLRVFLEQMGGGALYPDHPLKEGEEWKVSLDSPPTKDFPFSMAGENVLRFVGKTRHGKIKAAIVDIHFTNLLKPSTGAIQGDAAWIQLQAKGLGLDIAVRGEGKGRILVALNDGHLLQNQTTIVQKLTAEMPETDRTRTLANGPLSLQIDSETQIHVDEAAPSKP